MIQETNELIQNGSVFIDGIAVETIKKEIDSCNIIEVEVGTTGYCGGDTGHGGRTYFKLKDLGCTDMRLRIEQTGNHADEIEIILGGDCEMETFVEALEFAAENLRERMHRKETDGRTLKQIAFANYLGDVMKLYAETNSLRGMSGIRAKYQVSGLTKEQFYELGLNTLAKEGEDVTRKHAFCNDVYDYALKKKMECPDYFNYTYSKSTK